MNAVSLCCQSEVRGVTIELVRIVLADDHWLMRDETRRILEQYPDLRVVGEAEDGQQALELVERLQPDLAILDIRMPKLSGIEVVRQMKESSPTSGVSVEKLSYFVTSLL